MWCQSIVSDEDVHKNMVGVYSCFKKANFYSHSNKIDIDKIPIVKNKSQDNPAIISDNKKQSNILLMSIAYTLDHLFLG